MEDMLMCAVAGNASPGELRGQEPGVAGFPPSVGEGREASDRKQV